MVVVDAEIRKPRFRAPLGRIVWQGPSEFTLSASSSREGTLTRRPWNLKNPNRVGVQADVGFSTFSQGMELI
jgi:hypothetical protein